MWTIEAPNVIREEIHAVVREQLWSQAIAPGHPVLDRVQDVLRLLPGYDQWVDEIYGTEQRNRSSVLSSQVPLLP